MTMDASPSPLCHFWSQFQQNACFEQGDHSSGDAFTIIVVSDNAKTLPQEWSTSIARAQGKTALTKTPSGIVFCRWDSSVTHNSSKQPARQVARTDSPQKPQRRGSFEQPLAHPLLSLPPVPMLLSSSFQVRLKGPKGQERQQQQGLKDHQDRKTAFRKSLTTTAA